MKISLNNLINRCNNYLKLSSIFDYNDPYSLNERFEDNMSYFIAEFTKFYKKNFNEDISDYNINVWLKQNKKEITKIIQNFHFLNDAEYRQTSNILSINLDLNNISLPSASLNNVIIITNIDNVSLIKENLIKNIPLLKKAEFMLIDEIKINKSIGMPDIYFYKFNLNFMNKEMAFDSYLFKALSSMSFYLPFSSHYKFYYKNKDKIQNLRKSFAQNPKYLGGGADGSAFDIGNDLVLKIFSDSHSYLKAKEAMERLYLNPEYARTEAMIHDIGKIGEIEGHNIYYYIQNKMKPVTNFLGYYDKENLYDIATIIGNEINSAIRENNFREVKQKFNDPNFKDEVLSKINDLKHKIEDEIVQKIPSENLNKIKEDCNLIDNWIGSFIEQIIFKYLTGRTDLHFGNLGITNGELVYFDPAYQDWQSRFNLPAMVR